MSKKLFLFHDLSRAEVHNVFAPEEPFTPQAGSWGLHGIIRLNTHPGDFVLFVTFGQSGSGYNFDEGLDVNGILRWQSQPAQTLQSKTVQDLINQSEDGCRVHLFLRTASKRKSKSVPYTYLGLLQYVTHDAERERPVHIAWQLLDWPIPADVMQRIQLNLDSEASPDTRNIAPLQPGLTLIAPPVSRTGQVGRTTRDFQARHFRPLSGETSKAIGDAGECLALDAEIRFLIDAGRPDLARKVEHVAVTRGDGAGYDIRSFNADGSDRFVEVKTTTGSKDTPFFVSINEVAFSEHVGDAFVLFRIADFDCKNLRRNFFTLQGPLHVGWELMPNNYLAFPKGK